MRTPRPKSTGPLFRSDPRRPFPICPRNRRGMIRCLRARSFPTWTMRRMRRRTAARQMSLPKATPPRRTKPQILAPPKAHGSAGKKRRTGSPRPPTPGVTCPRGRRAMKIRTRTTTDAKRTTTAPPASWMECPGNNRSATAFSPASIKPYCASCSARRTFSATCAATRP